MSSVGDSGVKKEIGIAINNAMALIKSSKAIESVSEGRARSLRNYMEATLEAHRKHVVEGQLSAEELVFILVAAALVTHGAMVMTVGRLAMYEDLVKQILDDQSFEETPNCEKPKKKKK